MKASLNFPKYAPTWREAQRRKRETPADDDTEAPQDELAREAETLISEIRQLKSDYYALLRQQSQSAVDE